MKKRLISSVMALSMIISCVPMIAWGEEKAEITSNVENSAVVTNIGAQGTGLISIDFGTEVENVQKENISLYIGNDKVENYEFYSQNATGVTIDTKYFSEWDKAVSYSSIYPVNETECSVVVSGLKTKGGTEIPEKTINFKKSLVLPLDYKQGAVIENVALQKPVILAEKTIENKLGRGNKECVTDGVLYNKSWNAMFSPVYPAPEQNQVFFTVDLGKQYDIAGITLFGADLSASGRVLYSVECNNQPNTYRNAAKGHILWSGWDEAKNTILIGDVENEVATNFSYSANRQRYVHVGYGMSATGEKEIDVTELMVWAYVYGDEDTYKERQSLGNKYTDQYIAEAREKYATAEYSDYKTSLVDNYYGDNFGSDRPDPATLIWEKLDGADSYTLKISPKEDFSEETWTYENITDNRLDVYNLKTNSHYYWKVLGNNGKESGIYNLYTEDGVRYINAEKAKNIRDLGGWNGLNQGMAFRGSEINDAKGHNLGLDNEGVRIFREDLGIKSDLDLRAENEMEGITSSPLGEDINFVNVAATNYTGIFNESHIANFKKELEMFADIDNYPIYFHCWGGADRTGTLAFFLEGLCGVNEVDLAIDFELTSFSHFGLRYRYDTGSFKYASLLNKIKTYEGDTLQEKFENAAINTFGLTRAQIFNIKSILGGNGIAFANTAKGSDEGVGGTDATFRFKNMGAHTVKSVKFGEQTAEYTFENNTLTVSMPQDGGIGEIVFDDDTICNIYAIENKSTVASNVGGKTGVTNVGLDGIGLITVDFAQPIKELTSDNVEVYVEAEQKTDIKITPTQNGFTIDPMYFSSMTTKANSRNIYPASGQKCKMIISGVTGENGTNLGKYEVSFESGLIVPVPYKENNKLVNVSKGVVPTLAEGVTENQHDRGNKEVVTDGVIYNNDWKGMFSPTFEKSVAGQVVYTLDLGAEYNIAGIALSGDDRGSGNNNFYAVECNNTADTKIMAEENQDLRLTQTNGMTDYIGFNKHTEILTSNEILTNFNIGEKKSRYVHVGTSIAGRQQVTASEIMVWAYVEPVKTEPTLVGVGDDGVITNVGAKPTEYVKLVIDENISLNNSINVELTAVNGGKATVSASKIDGENAYRIETKAFAGLSTEKNKVQGFLPSGTVKVKIIGETSTDGKYVTSDDVSANAGQIVPLDYVEGKIIVDVAAGKGTYLPNKGQGYDFQWTGDLTDGNNKTSNKVNNAKIDDEIFDCTKPVLKLDLGAEYEIAAMAVSGLNSDGHWSTRYQRVVTSNDPNLGLLSDGDVYLKTPGISMVADNQILSNFSGNTVNARYVYVGNQEKQTNGNDVSYNYAGLSDIYVWAYVDADAKEMYVANSADGGIKAGTYYNGTNTLIIGEYDSEGKFVKAVMSNNGTVSTARDGQNKYKAFMWDTMLGAKPLTNSVETR